MIRAPSTSGRSESRRIAMAAEGTRTFVRILRADFARLVQELNWIWSQGSACQARGTLTSRR
jgi:hypothetical protein